MATKKEIAVKDNGSVFEYTQKQVDIIYKQIATDCPQPELEALIMRAQVQGMNVFLGECHFVPQKSGGQTKWIIVASIDFQRKRTGKSAKKLEGRSVNAYYIDEKGEHKTWINVPKKGYPTYPDYAKAILKVDGVDFEAIAAWKEYAKTNYQGEVMSTWKTMPGIMICKCAESLALRQAYPDELGGIYTDTEMGVEVKNGKATVIEAEITDDKPEPIVEKPKKEPKPKPAPKEDPKPEPKLTDEDLKNIAIDYKGKIEASEYMKELDGILAEFDKDNRLPVAYKNKLFYYYLLKSTSLSMEVNALYDTVTNTDRLTEDQKKELITILQEKVSE